MMKTKKILEFLGLDTDTKNEETAELTNEELFEAEISEVLTELSVMHSDTEEYKKSVESLKSLIGSYDIYRKSSKDDDFDKQVKLKLIEITPKIVGCLGSAGIMVFWFLTEQGHPVSNRLVNKIDNLLVR